MRIFVQQIAVSLSNKLIFFVLSCWKQSGELHDSMLLVLGTRHFGFVHEKIRLNHLKLYDLC